MYNDLAMNFKNIYVFETFLAWRIFDAWIFNLRQVWMIFFEIYRRCLNFFTNFLLVTSEFIYFQPQLGFCKYLWETLKLLRLCIQLWSLTRLRCRHSIFLTWHELRTKDWNLHFHTKNHFFVFFLKKLLKTFKLSSRIKRK